MVLIVCFHFYSQQDDAEYEILGTSGITTRSQPPLIAVPQQSSASTEALSPLSRFVY